MKRRRRSCLDLWKEEEEEEFFSMHVVTSLSVYSLGGVPADTEEEVGGGGGGEESGEGQRNVTLHSHILPSSKRRIRCRCFAW